MCQPPSSRIVSSPSQNDEHVVLRLAREALRQDPPRVQFVGKSGQVQAQAVLTWPVFG